MEAVPFNAAALVEFAATPEVALLLVELPESAISISLVELAVVLFDEPPDEVLLDEPPGEVLLEEPPDEVLLGEPPDEVLLEEPPEVVLLALVELLASSISIWLVELAEVLLDEPAVAVLFTEEGIAEFAASLVLFPPLTLEAFP